MKNRIPDYLPAPRPTGRPAQPAYPELFKLAQQKFVFGMRQVNTYVTEHPAMGIGAAFSIGVFLAWVIKRR